MHQRAAVLWLFLAGCQLPSTESGDEARQEHWKPFGFGSYQLLLRDSFVKPPDELASLMKDCQMPAERLRDISIRTEEQIRLQKELIGKPIAVVKEMLDHQGYQYTHYELSRYRTASAFLADGNLLPGTRGIYVFWKQSPDGTVAALFLEHECGKVTRLLVS